MLRVVVASQIIASVGYDSQAGLLEVEFRNGWIYEYDDVPRDVHAALMAAPSHGRYLHQHVVDAYLTGEVPLCTVNCALVLLRVRCARSRTTRMHEAVSSDSGCSCKDSLQRSRHG